MSKRQRAGRDGAAAVRDVWDINAAAWARAVREGAIASRKRGTDRAILDAVAALPPGPVLDAGCGEGWLARALAAESRHVTGFDGSEALVAHAKAGGGGSFHCASYEALITDPALCPGPFIGIVCNFALFAAGLQPLLGAFTSRLAPGGTLLIQTVHPQVAERSSEEPEGWQVETFREMGEGFEAPLRWYRRTRESWLRELSAAGFRVRPPHEPKDAETGSPLSLLLAADAPR